MNRIERLTAIVILLQTRRRTSTELARVFEVSKRTILRDVQALSEMGIPIVSEEGALGGYFLLPEYSLAPLQLTYSEALLLLLALQTLRGLVDTPFHRERESLLAKMHSLIPAPQRQQVENYLERIQIQIPERTQAVPFLEQLLQSAARGQWLRVEYHSARGPSTQHILPKRLYLADGFWYCAAYSQERREDRVFRVDRFVDARTVEPPPGATPYQPQQPYDHPAHPEVVVKLTYRGRLELERDPFFARAIQIEDDGHSVCCFRCPPHELDWLARVFLGLGLEAEIVSPVELKSRAHSLAQAIAGRYAEW